MMIRQISVNDLQGHLLQLFSEIDFKMPYGVLFAGDEPNFKLYSKKLWDDYPWNPPKGYTTPDPEASPKPTWEFMVARHKQYLIDGWVSETQGRYHDEIIDEQRNDAADAPITIDTAAVHVGAGLSHMTGLMHLSEDSARAGRELPNVIVRTTDNQQKRLFLESEMRDLLAGVGERENVIQSAHNIIQERYKTIEATIQDDSKTFEERETAYTQWNDIRENYSKLLTDEIGKINLNAEPADLPTLKLWLTERLEAAGMRRVKYLKGVVSQQGVDLPDSCVDQTNALQTIAQIVDGGSGDITEANDITTAKNGYNIAVTQLGAVWPLNTPHFWLNNGASLGSHPITQILQSHSFVFTADHPRDDIPGRVRVPRGRISAVDADDNAVEYSYVDYVRQANETRSGGSFSVNAQTYAGQTLTIQFEARNRCGPSVLRIQLEVPND